MAHQLGGDPQVLVERPSHRRPQLIEDLAEADQRGRFVRGAHELIQLGDRRREPLGVPPAGRVVRALLPQPLAAVAADGLERRVANAIGGGRRQHERPVDQPRHRIGGPWQADRGRQVAGAHRPGEHGELVEGGEELLVEQALRPAEEPRSVRCRASTSRREVASTSRSRSIDEATSASVIVRSRAAAISSASGRPSRRATTCRTRSSSSGTGALFSPSMAPAAAARWRNSWIAGASVPAVASGPSEMTCSPSDRQRLPGSSPGSAGDRRRRASPARRRQLRRRRARSCRAR